MKGTNEAAAKTVMDILSNPEAVEHPLFVFKDGYFEFSQGGGVPLFV